MVIKRPKTGVNPQIKTMKWSRKKCLLMFLNTDNLFTTAK